MERSDRPFEQYADESNLATRGSFNGRFSVRDDHPHEWGFEYVREALDADADVLELGGGTGPFWRVNAGRIPAGWTVTLTDLSPGMVADARRNLADVDHPVGFATAAAGAIPVRAGSVDAVVANLMLYHVPDRAAAFREVRRVLRPDGGLFATTVTRDSKATLYEMLDEAATGEGQVESPNQEFTMADGGEELREFFGAVESYRYESPLEVADADAILEYVRSLPDHERLDPFDESDLPALRAIAARRLGDGPIRMQSDLGLFVARP